MTNPRILLLGGHGRVSLLLTPKLLSRSWDVISVVRDSSQKPAILEAGKAGPGKIEVLVSSIEDVKSDDAAKKILVDTKADWVVWSAGAGGKGGPERTYAIDRDSCIHFIRSATSLPSIKKFLLVSALSIRRNRAPWWNDESWALVQKVNNEVMPHYYKAKLAADDALTVYGEERRGKDAGFGWVSLRPGGLSDEEETDKVTFPRTMGRGFVSRGDVAEVTARLLEKEGVSGWYDLLGGEEEVGAAVERVLKEGVKATSIEGEDVEVMKKSLGA